MRSQTALAYGGTGLGGGEARERTGEMEEGGGGQRWSLEVSCRFPSVSNVGSEKRVNHDAKRTDSGRANDRDGWINQTSSQPWELSALRDYRPNCTCKIEK
jgi:hypothetical protein